MKPGTKVKMGEAIKRAFIASGCKEHVDEFGDCEGVVQGPTNYGTQLGPEVDVKWQPSDLRYAYLPEELEVINENTD